MTIKRPQRLFLLPIAGLALIASCTPEAESGITQESGYDADAPVVRHGEPARIGNGSARTYVVYGADGSTPSEVGVAIDEAGLAGLPQEMQMMELALPADAPLPYRFVGFEWNPEGHEPDGIYNLPHFDFHFYTVPSQEVHAILPDDPRFAEKANRMPEEPTVPAQYVVFAEPGSEPVTAAVPMMGVHWADTRSPELQAAFGNPAGQQPFTRTFLFGSWDGRFIFLEPMITLAHLQSRPDEVIEIPQPARYGQPGWYPRSYRIQYDADAREYRIGLVDLEWKE
jgi:hypothetical protein